jgi:hypothetical protein
MRTYSSLGVFGPALVVATVLANSGMAQVANAPEALAVTTRLAPRQHGPARIYGRRPEDLVWLSDNWSGYAIAAVSGSSLSFTVADGSWTVPTANCSVTPGTRTSPAYAAFWVGLDGFSSSSVEQTGTDSDCDGTTPTYYAWYEFYPNPAYELLNFPVSPGDHISAQVSYNSSRSEFTITITNVTENTSYTKSSKVSGAKRSSAEWIAEAPCCARGNSPLPLSDFGTVDFGSEYTGVSGTNNATDSSTSGPISAFSSNVQVINMETTTGNPEATPSSSLTDGTSSFQVTWNSEGTTTTSTNSGGSGKSGF